MLREERPASGRMLPLQRGTIGRTGCEYTLPDPEVSRRHAAIRDPGDGSYVLEDLGSRNGTWLNDRRLDAPAIVRAGDTIRIGNTVWLVTSA